jgi:hypothetical protein
VQSVASNDLEVRLTLQDGSVVLNNGKVLKPMEAKQPAVEMSREIKSGREAAVILEKQSRKLGDLPDVPEKMNAFCAVITYSMLGLSDADIAVALKTSEQNVKKLKDLDAYQQLVQMFDTTVFEDNKRAANHMLAKASERATRRMIEGIDSQREDIAIVAARDVMKLAGVGQQEEQTKRVGGLNIRIIRKGEQQEDEIRVEL